MAAEMSPVRSTHSVLCFSLIRTRVKPVHYSYSALCVPLLPCLYQFDPWRMHVLSKVVLFCDHPKIPSAVALCPLRAQSTAYMRFAHVKLGALELGAKALKVRGPREAW